METIPNTGKLISKGSIALIVVLAIAFLIAGTSTPLKYQWIVFFFLAATPTQIIIGIFWQNNLPFLKGFTEKAQPLKGLVLTLFSAVVGLFIGWLALTLVGKGATVLTPQLSHFLIVAIIITIWLAIVANFWPLAGRVKNSTIAGIAILVLAYLLAYGIWSIFFSYEVVADIAPWYNALIDPKGTFDFITAIVFIITSCPIILYLSLFDNWILDRWSKGKQPAKAFINTLLVIALTIILQTLFVKGLKMDPTVYMVLVPICMVFGVFLVNNMTQFQLFQAINQPLKGIYKMLAATAMGLSMYVIYYNFAPLVTGKEMIPGSEGNYQLDLWIADTMLGISFPLILVITGFFGFWPIKKDK